MIDRLTSILDLLSSRGEPLTLERVTVETGLPRSTASRILRQMMELEWVDHDQRGYRLGRRATSLAAPPSNQNRLRGVASPLLHELHVTTGVVTQLGVLDGSQIRVLDKFGGADATKIPTRVGHLTPATGAAIGIAVLSCMAAEDVDQLLAHRATIVDEERLRQQLLRARQQGLAERRPVQTNGVFELAAPILGPDGPVAAISLAQRCRPLPTNFRPLLSSITRRASLELFPAWAERHFAVRHRRIR